MATEIITLHVMVDTQLQSVPRLCHCWEGTLPKHFSIFNVI